MPRYYLDVTDSNQGPALDIEGAELPDENTARAEAIRDLYELAREMLPEAGRRDFSISVRNEAKIVVLKETLSVTVERRTLP
jgi:hypothetical protein